MKFILLLCLLLCIAAISFAQVQEPTNWMFSPETRALLKNNFNWLDQNKVTLCQGQTAFENQPLVYDTTGNCYKPAGTVRIGAPLPDGAPKGSVVAGGNLYGSNVANASVMEFFQADDSITIAHNFGTRAYTVQCQDDDGASLTIATLTKGLDTADVTFAAPSTGSCVVVGGAGAYRSYTIASPAVETATAYGIIFWDDIYKSQLDAAPVFKARNLPAVLNVVTSWVGTSSGGFERLTWDDIKQFYEAGWEIAGHTHTHANLTAMSQAAIYEEIARSQEILRAHGYRINGMSTPEGSGVGNANFLAAAAQAGIRWAGVNGYQTQPAQYGYTPASYPHFNWLQFPFRAASGSDLSNEKALIDRAVRTKRVLVLYAHSLPTNFTAAQLAELLDYGTAHGLVWTTMSTVMGKSRDRTLDILPSGDWGEVYTAGIDPFTPALRTGYPYGWYPADQNQWTLRTNDGNYVRGTAKAGVLQQLKTSHLADVSMISPWGVGKQFTVHVEYRTSSPKPTTVALVISPADASQTLIAAIGATTVNLAQNTGWTSVDTTYTVTSADVKFIYFTINVNDAASGSYIDVRRVSVTEAN